MANAIPHINNEGTLAAIPRTVPFLTSGPRIKKQTPTARCNAVMQMRTLAMLSTPSFENNPSTLHEIMLKPTNAPKMDSETVESLLESDRDRLSALL
ncbi:MAG: hypothetical protein HOL01_16685 [Planctomycetaceae bacterium]|nr:hypothetical protein [Planctomycetaceae bacterium]MBT6496183.1 hypothetical protein [Planctomycetaceae bacterium]